MKKITRIWTPLKDAIDSGLFTKRELYRRVNSGEWRDGFIIQKGTGSTHWKFFCKEDWIKWQKLDNYQAA